MTRTGDTIRPWEIPSPPARDNYPHNIGGAIDFYLHSLWHRLVSGFAETVADILSSVGTRFMRLIEPEMVDYVRPVISDLLAIPDLPAGYRQFLQSLQAPSHEAGAGLLAIVAGTVSNVAGGSLMGALTAKATYAVNRQSRPTLVTPEQAAAIAWRFPQWSGDALEVFRNWGYPEVIISYLQDISRPRADVGTWVNNMQRARISRDDVAAELSRRGLDAQNIDLILASAVRPLDVGDVITSWRRKIISTDDMRRRLASLGYGDTGINLIVENSKLIPDIGDLISMAVRDTWNEGIVQRWGYDEDYPPEVGEWSSKQGMSAEWARRYWRAHWQLPSVQMGYEMMHRRIISQPEMLDLLRTADYPAGWRDRMIQMSFSPYTRVDVRRMYGLGVLSAEQLVGSYMDLGYDREHAENLAEFTIRYEDENGGSNRQKHKDLTESLITGAYRRGRVDRAWASQALTDIGFSAEDVEFLLNYAEFQRQIELHPDKMPALQNDLADILQRAYYKRVINGATFSGQLTKLGYNDREIDLFRSMSDYQYAQALQEKRLKILAEGYVVGALSRTDAVTQMGRYNIPAEMQDALLAEWDLDKRARFKTVSESQLWKFIRSSVITEDEYRAELANLGYSDKVIDWFWRWHTYVPAAESTE